MSWTRMWRSWFGGRRESATEGGWRDSYERHAEAEAGTLHRRPVVELLQEVQAGRIDEYHRIWYVIAERAEPRAALPVLFASLAVQTDYLRQYHCAVAILHLLGDEPLVNGVAPTRTTAVDYTTARPTFADARARLGERIRRI